MNEANDRIMADLQELIAFSNSGSRSRRIEELCVFLGCRMEKLLGPATKPISLADRGRADMGHICTVVLALLQIHHRSPPELQSFPFGSEDREAILRLFGVFAELGRLFLVENDNLRFRPEVPDKMRQRLGDFVISNWESPTMME